MTRLAWPTVAVASPDALGQSASRCWGTPAVEDDDRNEQREAVSRVVTVPWHYGDRNGEDSSSNWGRLSKQNADGIIEGPAVTGSHRAEICWVTQPERGRLLHGIRALICTLYQPLSTAFTRSGMRCFVCHFSNSPFKISNRPT